MTEKEVTHDKKFVSFNEVEILCSQSSVFSLSCTSFFLTTQDDDDPFVLSFGFRLRSIWLAIRQSSRETTSFFSF